MLDNPSIVLSNDGLIPQVPILREFGQQYDGKMLMQSSRLEWEINIRDRPVWGISTPGTRGTLDNIETATICRYF
ncbi:hypothetical protein CEXT_497841 [Caerostris extrusa]|uniref:Uncharacterized protein n=1 Tax=Caerostris extrusa TaxID=172846 RepID=A0AAV4PI12_CAEEX|nr:hypothetical protein CEXT_497841 [Caerostris extrusa]